MDRDRALRVISRYRKAWLAAIFFVLALLIFRQEMRKHLDSPARRYLTVKRNISAGTPVYLPDLAADLAPNATVAGQLTDQDLAWLQGAVFRQPLEEGAPVCWDHLQLSSKWVGLSQRIPSGLRAMEIEAVGAQAVRPGDWVDLHQAASVDARGPTLVAEAVRVLDVDPKRARVSVGVPPELVENIQAQATGAFRLVVRNPDEAGVRSQKRKTRRKKPSVAVPVYLE